MTEVNESGEVGSIPADWRERKFKSELELLCATFIKAGGDSQVGAALLMRTASDIMSIAVLQLVQNEFSSVLAYLVSEVKKLGGAKDVPAEQEEPGADAGLRGREDGQDGSGALRSRDAGEVG